MIRLRRHLNLLLYAGASLVLYGGRTVVIVLCLVAVLFPFLTGISISEGIKVQSRISVEEGADFYVAGDGAGRNVPLSIRQMDRLLGLKHVARVVPRIVGRTYVGKRIATVVGLPGDALPETIALATGRVFEERGDIIVGSTLSRFSGLEPGTAFYLPVNRWKRLKVVGVFSSKATLWSARVIFMSFEDAAQLFEMQGMATDFLVYADPEYREVVDIQLQAEKQADGPDRPPLRIQSKELVWRYFHRGFDSRAGIFTALYIVAFSLLIPLIFVASGFGWSDRRREIGLLRVTGWGIGEIMEITFLENLLIGIAGTCLSMLAAFLWLRVFNGAFIAQFFIAESGVLPDFPVPSRFSLSTLFLAFALSMWTTIAGSLYAVWRTSTLPPAEAVA